jgi:hypothetical protein
MTRGIDESTFSPDQQFMVLMQAGYLVNGTWPTYVPSEHPLSSLLVTSPGIAPKATPLDCEH